MNAKISGWKFDGEQDIYIPMYHPKKYLLVNTKYLFIAKYKIVH